MKTKILTLILVVTIALTLTGCDNWAGEADEIEAAINARAALNIEVVNRLVESGLLSREAGDGMIKSINELLKESKKKIPEKSISWYIKGSWDAWESKPTLNEKFPYSEYTPVDDSGDYPTATGKEVEDSLIEPIDVIGATQDTALNELLSYKVCVIRVPDNSDASQTKASTPLDVISKAVENVKSSQTSDKAQAFAELDKYFYNTGKPLVDITKDENKIVAPTKLSSATAYKSFSDDNGDTVLELKTKSKEVGLGYDFTLTYEGVPVATLRFKEFNPTAISKLIGAEGISKDKYLVDTKNSKVYLLEYPVDYIKGFKMDNDGIYSAEFEQSDLLINLVTGQIKNKSGTELAQLTDKILHLGGIGNQGDKGQSSFVIYGETDIKNIGYDNASVKGARIVLRDYLELSYMPEIIEGEHLVAVGRKLRVHRFEGDKSNDVAYFIDRNGSIMNIDSIYISDIMDISSGTDGVKYKLGVEGDTLQNETEEEHQEEMTDNEWEHLKGTGQNEEEYSSYDREETYLLDTEYRNEIVVSTRFPGEIIALSDVVEGTSSKMILYAMAIDINPFTSALYAGWINTDDEEKGSLLWWNRWLSGNSFSYHISSDKLKQFFMGNYVFEMQKEGYVILDLEVVKKIQQQYDEESKADEVNNIRTIFVILGYALMAYSLLLLASWVLDVNTVQGLRLMSILTAGRWEAIQDAGELPNMEIGHTQYMTFTKTVTSTLIIMGVGLALIFLVIVALVLSLISMFGGIAELISKIILGNK